MDVSVIIVNYKTPMLVVDCINSIRKYTNGIEYEIIVVDNASGDESISIIKSNCKDIAVIENKENLGFAKANNIGVDISHGKYLFFLNSDTVLLNNAIYELYRYHKSSINIGALGCWLIDGDGENTLSAAKFSTVENSSEEYTVLLKNKFRKNKKICSKYIYGSTDYPVDVDVVIGADLFLRKDDFERVGRFDEDFFMYHEEMHLCNKLVNQLHRSNKIIPSPKIVHLCGKSPKKKLERDIMIDSNLFLYFRKIDIKKLPPFFGVKFFGIRILYYLKNGYTISDIKKYIHEVSKNKNYQMLKYGEL